MTLPAYANCASATGEFSIGSITLNRSFASTAFNTAPKFTSSFESASDLWSPLFGISLLAVGSYEPETAFQPFRFSFSYEARAIHRRKLRKVSRAGEGNEVFSENVRQRSSFSWLSSV